MVSKIGNSIIEIYIPKPEKEQILAKLEEQNVKVDLNYNITDRSPYLTKTKNPKEKMIRRLAFLYGKAKFANLKKCILSGLDEDDKDLIITAANQRKHMLDPSGRTGTTTPRDMEQI